MYFSTTTRSLICFAVIALISAPDVVARPVQGANGHVQDHTHSLSSRSDAELLGELLRRGRSRAGSNASASSTSSTKSVIAEVCKPKTAKRSLEDLLYARGSDTDVTSDEEDKRIKDIDPNNNLIVTAPPVTLTNKLGEGSQAKVYRDPTDPKLLVKHYKQSFSSFTPGNLYKEMKYLKRVGHYGNKFHYMANPPSKPGRQPQLTEAWMWVKLVPGIGLQDEPLGLLPVHQHSATTKETSAFALKHKVGSTERKTFIEKLITMVTAKALEYAKELGTLHLDVSEANVRIVMNGDTIVSVDLIDWGMATTTGCSPETQERIKTQVQSAFNQYLQ